MLQLDNKLGNDSLLDMLGGASLCNPLQNPGGFGVALVIIVSGVATTGHL